jgi:hypothetical protein
MVGFDAGTAIVGVTGGLSLGVWTMNRFAYMGSNHGFASMI